MWRTNGYVGRTRSTVQTTLYDLTEVIHRAAREKFGPAFDSGEFEVAYLINLLQTHRALMRTPQGVELKLEIAEA